MLDFSKTVHWIQLKFSRFVLLTIILISTNFHGYLVHNFRENDKGMWATNLNFLKTMHWIELKLVGFVLITIILISANFKDTQFTIWNISASHFLHFFIKIKCQEFQNLCALICWCGLSWIHPLSAGYISAKQHLATLLKYNNEVIRGFP